MSHRNGVLFRDRAVKSSIVSRLLVLCAIVVPASGCGYQLGFGGPEQGGMTGQRWQVPVVLNNSREPFLEGRFTNELIAALLRRGAQVVRGRGEYDRRLLVVVDDFEADPISLANVDRVSEFRLRITADVRVEDGDHGLMWKGADMTMFDEYQSFDETQLQEESRQAAIERALNRFSNDLVSRLLYGMGAEPVSSGGGG